MKTEKCPDCGEVMTIGSWPFCGDHGKPGPSKGYEAHFDYGLGEYITTPGDRNKLLRPKWENDYRIHIQPRDMPASHYRETKERRMEQQQAGKRNR